MEVVDRSGESRMVELDSLYRQYATWLLARVARYPGPKAPEDIVQETFIRVSQSYPANQLRHPKALLLKVAKNLSRSASRSELRTQRAHSGLSGTASQPGVAAEQLETILLRQTVLALPEIYRDVFLLSRFGGMSNAEIAQARGLAVKTVEWRMTQALKLCADTLRE